MNKHNSSQHTSGIMGDTEAPIDGWVTIFDHLTPQVFREEVRCSYSILFDVDDPCFCCLNPKEAWDCDGLKGRITECCHGLFVEDDLSD